jgi:hypothetical protein
MNAKLNSSLRTDTYIRLYFGQSKDLKLAAINRAFLDFCRTLPIEEGRDEHKEESTKYLITLIETVCLQQFENQAAFDTFHEEACEKLQKKWPQLTVGQAQKWLNMTLKYCLLFGEDKIDGIETNTAWFHIPIDSYVLKGLLKDKTGVIWSKISDYPTYLKLQQDVRDKNKDIVPIIAEFDFFNTYQ